MGRYRLSEPAKADIASVLRTRETMHGAEARIRCRALLTAAMRRVAADPGCPSPADRSDLSENLRSFHIRHSRNESREAPVGDPVHVIYYRAVKPSPVEIFRVLHERREPSRQFPAWLPGSPFRPVCTRSRHS
ncbi:type II toxin-antitoxin system RelE/ParE family toxin [Aestuariivirga sp.]|uniref:type II toxin-antitoxin system RelE/ParE family toxin n=1 Tax=Aestuariivirga sp. TaxID=2650926 RepID=UPI003459D14C|nr:type II toxin-antitoxin system RelE/ParE family toxin [Aestuariivirga sp.]